MFTFDMDRRKELNSKLTEILTEQEKQLLYEACMFTADELSATNKRFQNMLKPSNDLTAKAGRLYELAQALVEGDQPC